MPASMLRSAARSRRKRTSSESRRRKAAVIAGRDPDEQGGMMIAVPHASLPWNSAMQCRALDPRAILPVRGARRKTLRLHGESTGAGEIERRLCRPFILVYGGARGGDRWL